MSETLTGKHASEYDGPDDRDPDAAATAAIPAIPAIPVGPVIPGVPVVAHAQGQIAGPVEATSSVVVCPECGTTAQVRLIKRDATDFCVRCDYPLFWTPNAIVLDRSLTSDNAALHRLPGTAGRQTVASQKCRHCNEANTITAETCVRCGLSLLPEVAAVAPPVVAPVPARAAVPDKPPSWWDWALVGLVAAFVVAIVVYVVFYQ